MKVCYTTKSTVNADLASSKNTYLNYMLYMYEDHDISILIG